MSKQAQKKEVNESKSANAQINTKRNTNDKKVKKARIIVNITNTEYDSVKDLMKNKFGFKLSTDINFEWDLFWADTGVTEEMLCRMKKFQKVNHYPSMNCLARKNNLGKNLMCMRKVFPKEYEFFPSTWLLPSEWKEFRNQFNQKKCKTFIVKPEALSQGRGIFLTRSWENINPVERYVVQRYIHKPYLIDGLKFDLRMYVLIYGCDPLRIYIFKEGLARLATEPYTYPSSCNLNNYFMHLTNYAINKNNDNFVFNNDAERTDIGHKRSLSFVWKYINDHGGDSEELQREIRECIVKTMCAVQPQLADSYRGCQPLDYKNNKCFEILGFDILIDHNLKPWLLEVNHSPSFTIDTPFDAKVKTELLTDTLNILNLDPMKRIKFYKKKELESQNRCLGKDKRSFKKLTKEERLEYKKRYMAKRDKYELEHCGGFTRIYPDLEYPEKYANFIRTAKRLWEEFFSPKKNRKTQSIASTKPMVKEVAYKRFNVSRPVKKMLIPSRTNKTMKNYERAKSIENPSQKNDIESRKSNLLLPPIPKITEKIEKVSSIGNH